MASISHSGSEGSPTNPTIQTQTKATVARYLTTIILSSIEAVNSRNFDTTKSPWTSYAASFRNEPDGKPPFIDNLAIKFNSQKSMPLAALLQLWKSLAAVCPAHRNEVIATEVYAIDLVEGKAELALQVVVRGIPEGVVRPSVSVVEFRRMGGKWWCTRQRTLPGLDFGGGLIV